jgi:hyperosmotically inducible protein
MKRTIWIALPVFALALLAAPLSAQDAETRVKDGAKATKDAVVKDTKIAANKTQDALSKTGEVITDAWITSRVHSRFVGDGLLKDSDISVDTDHHVVTLKGTVTGRAGRTQAATIARHTEGVRRVVNQLTIAPKA